VAFIVIKTGPNKGKKFEIGDAPITVGREETQIIQILDQGVSRAHAEIFRLGEMCFVRDLNSTNGTYVNDVKVSEESLKAGDELLIGTTILVFADDHPAHLAGGGSVEFEGEEGAKIETTTVELKVEEKVATARVLGQEVQSRNITLTSQVGRILRGTGDAKAAFDKTLELLAGAIGASQGYFFGVDPDGKFVPRAVVEIEEVGAEKKVSRTIANRVRQSAMPLLTSDATLDGRFTLSESIILKKIKSVICAPILTGERVEGLLYFHSSKVDHTLSVEDLELVTSVALQLSLASAHRSEVERLRKGLMGTVRALVNAIEAAEPKERGHAQRVSDYAAVLGAQLEFPADEVHRTRLAGLLHDVGKLAVRQANPAAPAAEIREQHVQAGERMLTGIEEFDKVLPGIRYHHERADGSGFPYRLKNPDLPPMARVVIVANAFDNACSGGGPDGAAIPAKDVVKDMAQRGGKEFDDDVIRALVLCHRNGSLYGTGRA
jgi:HD-GYP domain-containing protein (c-di-GMP phosphodiesterase class II)/pSer/pThr/pTyr-binding forkhead associated (FHA) protein